MSLHIYPRIKQEYGCPRGAQSAFCTNQSVVLPFAGLEPTRTSETQGITGLMTPPHPYDSNRIQDPLAISAFPSGLRRGEPALQQHRRMSVSCTRPTPTKLQRGAALPSQHNYHRPEGSTQGPQFTRTTSSAQRRTCCVTTTEMLSRLPCYVSRKIRLPPLIKQDGQTEFTT